MHAGMSRCSEWSFTEFAVSARMRRARTCVATLHGSWWVVFAILRSGSPKGLRTMPARSCRSLCAELFISCLPATAANVLSITQSQTRSSSCLPSAALTAEASEIEIERGDARNAEKGISWSTPSPRPFGVERPFLHRGQGPKLSSV